MTTPPEGASSGTTSSATTTVTTVTGALSVADIRNAIGASVEALLPQINDQIKLQVEAAVRAAQPPGGSNPGQPR